MNGCGLVILGQAAALSPGVLSLVGNGGVGVALIVVVYMFLQRDREREQRDRERDAKLVGAIEHLADRFEAKLSEIEGRHFENEREGRVQIQGLIDRHLVVTKGLIETLGEVKLTLQANVEATRANTEEIRDLKRERRRSHDEGAG